MKYSPGHKQSLINYKKIKIKIASFVFFKKKLLPYCVLSC